MNRLSDEERRLIREKFLGEADLKRFGYVAADWTDSYSLWLETQLLELQQRRSSEGTKNEEGLLPCPFCQNYITDWDEGSVYHPKIDTASDCPLSNRKFNKRFWNTRTTLTIEQK